MTQETKTASRLFITPTHPLGAAEVNRRDFFRSIRDRFTGGARTIVNEVSRLAAENPGVDIKGERQEMEALNHDLWKLGETAQGTSHDPNKILNKDIAAVLAEKDLSRRKLLLRMLVGGMLVSVSDVAPLLPEFWDEYGAMITGEVDDLNQIPSVIPDSLRGQEIPKRNPWFRKAEEIFQEGLVLSQQDGETMLKYAKPKNYLSTLEVVDILVQDIVNNPLSLLGGVSFIYSDLLDIISRNDEPYSAFLNGSAANINKISGLIAHDPGTGLVRTIRSALENKYGINLWNACKKEDDLSRDPESAPVLTLEQRTEMVALFNKWYNGAMDYVKAERVKKGEQISTNVLFAYFLRQNNGDILASVWDTAIWLKILVRNDTENPDPTKVLAFDPSYARAKLATDLFKDEFSPSISVNWVVDTVSPTDPVLNYVGGQNHNDPGYNYKDTQYKDYMPPNRAGGYYHAWNIMALMLCMDTEVVTRMLATHINPVYINGHRSSEYGREKDKADMLVVGRTEEIKKSVKPYAP